MNKSSIIISPLPKIILQKRQQKVSTKITQMIKKLGKRREMQIIQERIQGFWMQDQVKNSLDRIKIRTNKMKTQMLGIRPFDYLNEVKKNKHHTVMLRSNQLNKKSINNFHLPELKQMIQSRQRQSNSLICAKRRKILHLLILGLNRRNYGKLYEAIDIILLASYYFQKDDQQRKLKTICLNLISKLHKQIKQQNLCLKRKSKLNKKRKSLTVVNYFSRQNFMENFMEKLRKTKLMGQFSYVDSQKNSSNTRRINAKCDVIVPKPEQIFQQYPEVKNYDYIAITVDDYTNMFPYQYPKSLNQKITPATYRQLICKLNGLLFPQSKCYSFSSIIKIFYLQFLLIFLIILSFTILRTAVTGQAGRIFLIIFTILLIFVLGIKICLEESGYTNYIEIKDKMKAYLNQWEDLYFHQNIKFRMGDNVDAIFIAFPSELPDSSLASSKLTQIQQVDENFTQNLTDSKGIRQEQQKDQNTEIQSIKGIRRNGSKFDKNGNLMKKVAYSKFANRNTIKKASQLNIENQKQINKQLKTNNKVTNKQSQSYAINNITQCQSRLDQQVIQQKELNTENLKDNQKVTILSEQPQNSSRTQSIKRIFQNTQNYQVNKAQSIPRICNQENKKLPNNKKVLLNQEGDKPKNPKIAETFFKEKVCQLKYKNGENINHGNLNQKNQGPIKDCKCQNYFLFQGKQITSLNKDFVTIFQKQNLKKV